MTICVISQPRFFPGLHYLHRMMLADVFVILDSVQYNPRHEENRTRVKSLNGPQWLTVPTRKLSQSQLICQTKIDNKQSWRKRIVKTLGTLYGKAPYFKKHAPDIFSIIDTPFATITELDKASWGPSLKPLEITCEFVLASDLALSGSGPQLLLEICSHFGATTYLSGAFGRDYIDTDLFAAGGIEVRFHEFIYPVYEQRFNGFVPYLSYLDALFNIELDPRRIAECGHMMAS